MALVGLCYLPGGATTFGGMVYTLIVWVSRLTYVHVIDHSC